MEGGRDEGESYDGPVKELLVLPLHSEEEHVDDYGSCWPFSSLLGTFDNYPRFTLFQNFLRKVQILLP